MEVLSLVFPFSRQLEKVAIQRDETGLSKGYGFVEVRRLLYQNLHVYDSRSDSWLCRN